ncbi:MAG: enoyl-CoA hydratase-related protein [Actinomycetota bacterium]|nr:enoyl-CoA hydratase-related protein [Actinomycetota bacterium]
MPASPLRVDRRDDGVVVLTLDLPDRRNAMTAELTEAWVEAVTGLKGDRSARCVVVTGAGSAFCAGGDVSWIGSEPDATADRLRDRMAPFYRAWLSIRDLDVPTVAAINGPAVGAGLAMAMACDLRYATDAAKMSVPFTSLGMHPGMATTWLLPQLVGLPAARELFFTGRAVAGPEAVALGLVNRVFPAEGFLDEVLRIAATIAATAPVATRLTKVALANGGHAGFEAALEWESLAQPVTLATQDLQEGLRARAERRRPDFTGR